MPNNSSPMKFTWHMSVTLIKHSIGKICYGCVATTNVLAVKVNLSIVAMKSSYKLYFVVPEIEPVSVFEAQFQKLSCLPTTNLIAFIKEVSLYNLKILTSTFEFFEKIK